MLNLVLKFLPADIIALVVIIGGLILKLQGADGVVGSMLVGVCFYYFGKKGNIFSVKSDNV